jgi:hypothetical protein
MSDNDLIARDGTPERDHAILSAAVEVLRERYGMVVAWDLIAGLNGARADLLSEGDAASPGPRNATLERKLSKPWEEQ